jgi:hypothetical protein
MSGQDPQSGWMAAYPVAAAVVAGGLAAVIRHTTSTGPRPWKMVLADAVGTVSISWLTYHFAVGAGASHDLSFGVAGLVAALGWEWLRRAVLPKLLDKMGK